MVIVVKRNNCTGMGEFGSLLPHSGKELPSKTVTDTNVWHQGLINTNVKVWQTLTNMVDNFPEVARKLQPTLSYMCFRKLKVKGIQISVRACQIPGGSRLFGLVRKNTQNHQWKYVLLYFHVSVQ